MNKNFEFKGDVSVNGKIHSSNIVMSTWAPTEKKALSNIRYRYRQEYNLGYGVPIEFDGKWERKN